MSSFKSILLAAVASLAIASGADARDGRTRGPRGPRPDSEHNARAPRSERDPRPADPPRDRSLRDTRRGRSNDEQTTKQEQHCTTAALPTAEELVQQLGLVPHPEGGFFSETYRAGAPPMQSQGLTDPQGFTINVTLSDPTASGPSSSREVPRNTITSIYYMLTTAAPMQVFVELESEIVRYWHAGGRTEYITVSESGQLERQVLGPRLQEGDVMQLAVGRHTYTAARLLEGEFVLLGEAVGPGFDYRDQSFVSVEQLEARLGAELTPELAAMTQEAVEEAGVGGS